MGLSGFHKQRPKLIHNNKDYNEMKLKIVARNTVGDDGGVNTVVTIRQEIDLPTFLKELAHDKLFENKYPYVERIIGGFCHYVADLLKIHPAPAPSGQALATASSKALTGQMYHPLRRRIEPTLMM
nr:hypothetical protein [Tanacetum cinerariifolium]